MTDHFDIVNSTVQSILKNTEDFAFVKDKNFIYRGSSAAFAKDCVGLRDIDDIIGKTDYEIFKDQEIAHKYRDDDERMFREGISKISFREAYPKKDGKNRYCLTTKYLIRDEEGNPAGIFGQCYDITAQIELEQINDKDLNRKLAAAMNNLFYANYLGNVQDDSFAILRGKEYAVDSLGNCKSLEEAFRCFLDKLILQEDKDKMQEFCNLKTLPARLKDGMAIECEYRSAVTHNWCKSTIIPVDYDENGELTFFMLVISNVDAMKASELEEHISNKKYMEAIFDKVQGGLVMYRWDGEKLHILNISKYYEEQYGESMCRSDGPDFKRIHPEDVEAYKEAIYEALTKTHSLEYVYRVWNRMQNRYVWVQINATSEEQSDGTSLVYAMYSDVTRQKEAELRLEKQSASLVAALSASNQLCYEYDPVTHVEECLTEDQIFHLPKVIENYPEAMLDIVHPDDRELFLQTIHSVDCGIQEASCNIRLLENGQYVWYAYRLHSIFDVEKQRIIALLSIINNTEHVRALEVYEQRAKALLSLTEDTLALGTLNLTNNTFEVVHVREEVRNSFTSCKTVDNIFEHCAEFVIGEEKRKEYLKLFARENLLALAEKGQLKVQMDHLYRRGAKRSEWIRTCVDMLKNPVTGDITGVCYANSIQEAKIKDDIIERMLSADYLTIALINAATDNFYVFDTKHEKYCSYMENFWTKFDSIISRVADIDVVEYLSKENILSELNKKNEYTLVFNDIYNNANQRLECRFFYSDKEQGTLMMTLRNITDEALLKKYKFDSEHDPVTGLLNRRAVLEKCRKLIDEHPGEHFVMLHGDMKNFRLFNSFFGEEEGDRLLCAIADCIRTINKDYEYWAYGRIEADVFCAFSRITKNYFKSM